MVAVPPFTSRALPAAPLSVPFAKVIVPFRPTRLTFLVPPVDVSPPKTTLTVGVATPVRSSPPPFVFIESVLTVSVPTLLPAIAVPPVQLPILKPERVLFQGAPAKVTHVPALVVVGVGAATVNKVMLLTTRLTP